MGAAGSSSQDGIERPSAGNAVRKSDRCSATRRWFVRPSASTTHCATISGFQPLSRAITLASRRRRSATISKPLGSTSSVLISTSRSVRRPGCQATRSTTPRSPKLLKDASGRTSQPAATSIAVIRSSIAACRPEITRSIRPPRQLGSIGNRTSSTLATLRRVARVTRSMWPRSIAEYSALETRALSATSSWRQPRRSRTPRSRRPMPMSSTTRIVIPNAYLPVACQPPAWPRSTNWPKPRVPTNAPSRMTGRPRTKTERTAPVRARPS